VLSPEPIQTKLFPVQIASRADHLYTSPRLQLTNDRRGICSDCQTAKAAKASREFENSCARFEKDRIAIEQQLFSSLCNCQFLGSIRALKSLVIQLEIRAGRP
jgi:hypothetical protein